MSNKTGIEWTRGDDGAEGATWNPTTGCDKISPGCGLPRFDGDDEGGCYALSLASGKGLIEGRGGYSIHHLILRSHGVDNRVEAQVLACGSGSTGCHGWIHANPVEAMAAGWIRRGNARPGTGLQPVKVAFPDGYRWFVLLADGTRIGAEAPEGTAAA